MYTLPKSHRGTVTLLSTSGGHFTEPLTCKDHVHDSLMYFFYPSIARKKSVTNMMKAEPNIQRPGFVFYYSDKTAKKNAVKFAQFINGMEVILGLEERSVPVFNGSGLGEKSAPFVILAPQWWLKSPISVSTYLTFLRLSPFMRMGEALNLFVDRMINRKNNDTFYLRSAVNNGNLKAFLNKSMKALNREGYSDYILSNHGRGFCGYSIPGDNFQMDEKSLLTQFG